MLTTDSDFRMEFARRLALLYAWRTRRRGENRSYSAAYMGQSGSLSPRFLM